MATKTEINDAEKLDLALALLLLKDFKTQGKFDVKITTKIFEMAEYLGVRDELNSLMSKIPPMKIEERYP